MKSETMPSVFISYHHEDRAWKGRLQKQLDVLGMEGILDVWEDGQIAAGADWHAEIKQAIERANVAVLLISADFLTSQFIRDEEVGPLLARLHKNTLHVIPVLIRPCPWRPVDWLSKIQIRPADGREVADGTDVQIDRDFASIAEEISNVINSKIGKSRGEQSQNKELKKTPLISLPEVGEHLLGRERELEWLDQAWMEDGTRIISLVAWGGVGKSALAKHWLDYMERDGFRGADAVYAWSFHSQVTTDSESSADEFFDDALRWFGEIEPERFQHQGRASRLAELIRCQKTLLVLDGLEPLQYSEVENPAHAGELKDRSLAELLRTLSWDNPGLCLITTRVQVADIQDRRHKAAPVIELENLLPAAGGAVLDQMGISGETEELQAASEKVKGHSLALVLLGTYLRDFCEGDIRRIDEVDLFHTHLKRGDHARRIMAAYERAFDDEPEQAALHLLGLFDRRVKRDLIDVLRQAPIIKGLNKPLVCQSDKDWQLTLNRLDRAGLLSNKNNEALEAHPLVLEYFGNRLRTDLPRAWRAGHLRLYQRLLAQSEKDRPDNLSEMMDLFQAIHHACAAGQYQQAYTIYRARITRGDDFYLINKLGAFSADLTVIVAFFHSRWDKPAADLDEAAQTWLLHRAATDLRAVARLREAVVPKRAGLEKAVKQKDWKSAATSASDLSGLLVTLGDLAPAAREGDASISYADRSGDDERRIITRVAKADAVLRSGDIQAAKSLCEDAEAIQAVFEPECAKLHSMQGYRYCDLLLTLEQAHDVQRRAAQMLDWANVDTNASLLELALPYLSLGRAALALGELDKAKTQLDEAVDRLKGAGSREFESRGLLARAALFREARKSETALKDLGEAMRIAKRGEMRLLQCDAHLEYARLALVECRFNDARKSLRSAKALVLACGYHRRDGEVAALERALT